MWDLLLFIAFEISLYIEYYMSNYIQLQAFCSEHMGKKHYSAIMMYANVHIQMNRLRIFVRKLTKSSCFLSTLTYIMKKLFKTNVFIQLNICASKSEKENLK